MNIRRIMAEMRPMLRVCCTASAR